MTRTEHATRATIKDIKIHASQFIGLNKGHFTDVYKTGKTIGDGATGRVAICQHKVTHEKRAVKFIDKKKLQNVGERDRFL
jgi:hypothetical protein